MMMGRSIVIEREGQGMDDTSGLDVFLGHAVHV